MDGSTVNPVKFSHQKYLDYETIDLPDRTWPSRTLSHAPSWCSVDLRDGNQALIQPMSVTQKLRFFQLLVGIGFKEIEIGFPAAAQPEYEFTRALIEKNLIPEDVTIQVLTQAREQLVAKTFEALKGVKRAIVHVYNSTSRVQREQVFAKSDSAITQIAVQGAQWIQQYAEQYPETEWIFQYSPESFTGTEIPYAVSVCNAVIDQWQPEETGQKVIINLPATVEMSTPNIFADQIEIMNRSLKQRDHITLSIHTHNDRGCAVAASELALLAGADRIEGTLFGNGERTGNADLITIAMNLYSRGINPQLDFSNSQTIIETYEHCTQLPVHPRHPWLGELVYTAFSGSHQDAIRKSMAYHQARALTHWDVAYLPIDPADLGRDYEAIVRINSQSGKGGVALVLERDYQLSLPKWMHAPIAKQVQRQAENAGTALSSQTIYQSFEQNFLQVSKHFELADYHLDTLNGLTQGNFKIIDSSGDSSDKPTESGAADNQNPLIGAGRGPIEALVQALSKRHEKGIDIQRFEESAIGHGTQAQALACIELTIGGKTAYGCAIAADSIRAGLQAVLTAFWQGWQTYHPTHDLYHQHHPKDFHDEVRGH